MNGDDFWSLFDDKEVEVVPQKMRKFLHRERAPAEWTQSFGLYAYGYSYAFERMVMIAIELWPRADYLQMPVFFLARHAAELQLKEIIERYATYLRVPPETASEHRLLKLWERACSLMASAGAPASDRWTNHCRKLVQHLHDADPDGQRFRYPQDNSGTPFSYTRVELEQLAKAHGHIRLWCEASVDMFEGRQSDMRWEHRE